MKGGVNHQGRRRNALNLAECNTARAKVVDVNIILYIGDEQKYKLLFFGAFNEIFLNVLLLIFCLFV